MKYRLLALCGASLLISSCAIDDDISGFTNEDLLVNVLDNDINPTTLTAQLIDTDGLNGVTLAADGTLNIPAGNEAGAYNLIYAACRARGRRNFCAPGNVNVILEQNEPDLILASIEMKPADIGSFPLIDLAIPADSIIISGQGDLDLETPEYLIVDGQLFIASPSDIGEARTFTLTLEGQNGQLSEIAISIITTRPDQIFTSGESPGEIDETFIEQNVALNISGLGPSNVLGGQDLAFSADTDKAISPTDSRITIIDDNFNVTDISSSFCF